MRSIALLIATAMIAPGCFTAEPETAEFYKLSVGDTLSNLALNSRPNMDATVKQIIGVAEDGTTYVVDLCLGVSTGAAVGASKEDVMVCIGIAQDPRGFDIQQHSCYDGRTSGGLVDPVVNVSLVDLGQGVQVLNGNVGVTVPDLQGGTGTVDVQSNFQVRVTDDREMRTRQDDSASQTPLAPTFPWSFGGFGGGD